VKKYRKKRLVPVPLASSRLRRPARVPPEPAGSQRYGVTVHFFTGSETIRHRWAAALVLAVAAASCREAPRPIIAGTGHIQAIVRDLTDGEREVRTLIPPAMCPGHFDMRPSDLEALARGGLLIIAAWQRHLPNVADVIQAARVPPDRLCVIDVPENWMVPARQAEAIEAVARVLEDHAADPVPDATTKAAGRVQAVRAFGQQLKRRLAEAEPGGVGVLCDEQQADFVRWAGFDIAATYGRPEDLSVAAVEHLIEQGRRRRVALVIDNLQSGDAKTGAALARDTGAVHVVLSNFPGGFDGTETWEKAVERNVGLLLGAIEQRRRGHAP